MGISLNYLRVFRTCTIFFLFQEYAFQDLFQSQEEEGGSAAKQVRQLEKTWERDAERADSDHVSSISDIFESD